MYIMNIKKNIRTKTTCFITAVQIIQVIISGSPVLATVEVRTCQDQ